MKLRTRALGVCLLATLAGAAAIGSGTAAAATSPVVGHVYVNDDGTRRLLDPRFDLANHSPTGFEPASR